MKVPTRLNVRCCCQPRKILGSLPWDGVSRVVDFKTASGEVVTLSVEQASLRLCLPREEDRRFHNVRDDEVDDINVVVRSEWAFKSEETPIDTLRQIPQFIEGVASDFDHE